MRLALIMAAYFCACSQVTPKEDSPKNFHIVVPDSLQVVKKEFLEMMARMQERSDWPYRFSDSADYKVFINPQSSYQLDAVYVTADSIVVADEHLSRDPYMIVHKTPASMQIFARTIKPGAIIGTILEMINTYDQYPEALMIRARQQIVFLQHLENKTWITDINVFEERKRYEQSAAVSGDRIKFHGGSLDYDAQRFSEIIAHYPAAKAPDVFVYPDYETKAQMTGNIMEYSYDFEKNRMHLVNTQLVKDRFPELISIYLAYQTYGHSYPWLTEGLGIYQAQTFFNRPFSWWSEKKPLLHLIDPIKLISKKSPDQNPFLYTYFSALFWEKFHSDVKNVFAAPEKFLKSFTPNLPPLKENYPVKTDIPFFKGLCYAHTNGIGSGYMSKRSRQSLEEIKALGANIVSVTPFGYSQTETSPEVFFVRDNNWDETLGSLFKVADDAHALGLNVMMKPHIWLGNGRWCGDINVEGEDHLKIWENTFTQFVVYHALIAELTGMQSLCLCVELPRMTPRTDLWKRVIRHARAAFSGYITYGANWYNEYDRIGFWDQLDFIGVQHYFPLAANQQYSKEEAEQRIAQLSKDFESLSEKWNRKIVLTEVGFPSIEYALLSPHEEIFSQAASEDVQAMGYDMTMREFIQKPWAGGLFWWKWESGRSPRAGDKSFQLKGKKAEIVLKKYYQAP